MAFVHSISRGQLIFGTCFRPASKSRRQVPKALHFLATHRGAGSKLKSCAEFGFGFHVPSCHLVWQAKNFHVSSGLYQASMCHFCPFVLTTPNISVWQALESLESLVAPAPSDKNYQHLRQDALPSSANQLGKEHKQNERETKNTHTHTNKYIYIYIYIKIGQRGG